MEESEFKCYCEAIQLVNGIEARMDFEQKYRSSVVRRGYYRTITAMAKRFQTTRVVARSWTKMDGFPSKITGVGWPEKDVLRFVEQRMTVPAEEYEAAGAAE